MADQLAQLPRRAGRGAWRDVLATILLPTAVIVGLIALWQLAASQRALNPLLFAKPTAAWDSLVQLAREGTLVSSTLETLTLLGLGWGSAVVLGTAIGVVVGASRNLADFVDPFLTVFNAVPRLLLMPMLIIWLGFGLPMKVTFVMLVVVSVVVTTVAAGMREIGRDLLTNVRVLGARRRDVVMHVYVPSIALWICGTARTTLGFALSAAVACELIGSVGGLGFQLATAHATFDAPLLWAVLVVTLVLGLTIDLALGAVEARATRWMPSDLED